MNLPSVRQLECLVAVSKTLNFRRAAELCFITQPALSSQIQQLEESLGVRLFERDRRRVLPTIAGDCLAARAREILADLQELSASATQFNAPLSGSLRLGVIPTIAPYLLPHAVGAIQSAYPKLRLLIREGQTAVLLKQLAGGELDLLLLALDVELGVVERLPLFDDAFLLAVPKQHPLAGQGTVKQSDLRGADLLLLEDGHCLRDQTLDLCHRAGACELGDFQASSLATIMQMVAGGVGITLLPEMSKSVAQQLAGNLRLIPFQGDPPSRSIGLAWRPSSLRQAEFESLGELLTRECAPPHCLG